MMLVSYSEREKVHEMCRDAVLCHAFDSHLGGRRPATIVTQGKGEVSWKPDTSPAFAKPIKMGQMCLEACGAPRHVAEQIPRATLAQLLIAPRQAAYHMSIPGVSADVAYNTTGMFSSIMMDAQNVILRQSYDEGRASFEIWANRGESVPDFKDVSAVIGGSVGDPQAISEGGEFEETTLVDGKEKFQLTNWGFRWTITWQAVMNDRTSAFTEVPAKMIRAMKRKQNKLVYDVLKKNRTMADTGALFNSTAVSTPGGHANQTTGAVSDYSAAFAAMLSKMAVQRGLGDDSGALNITPRFVLYPPALADKIGTLLKSMYVPGGTNNTANIYNANELNMIPVPEAELGLAFGGSDTAFYHVADSSDIDTVSYFHLEGYETPRVEAQPSFERLALMQRVYQPFAVKALDYRGLQQHTGA